MLADLAENTRIVCIEFAEGATMLPQFEHPDNVIYIFRPEDGSLPQTPIDAADHVVFTPTIGYMNLAATVNVVSYDRLSKSTAITDSKDTVASRDTKNRLVVNS